MTLRAVQPLQIEVSLTAGTAEAHSYEQQIVSAFHELAREHAAQARLSEAIHHQREALHIASSSGLKADAIAAEHVYLGQLMLRYATADAVATISPRESAQNGGFVRSEAEAQLLRAIKLAPANPHAHEALLCCEFDGELRAIWDHHGAPGSLSLRATHTALREVLARAEGRRRLAPGLCEPGPIAVDAALATSKDLLETAHRFWHAAGQCCDWLRDEQQLKRAQRVLAAGRPVSVRDAFRSQLATGARTELAGLSWACSDDGGVKPLAYGAFMMRRCMPTVSEESLANQHGSSVAAALTLLKSPDLKKLIGQLTGLRIDGATLTQPTLFRSGDFLSVHNDAQDHRVVAFAWHLVDEWTSDDGGELAFVCPEPGADRFVRPALNTLTLFRTHGPGFLGTHAVLPVLRGQRVAITGWFTQKVKNDASFQVAARRSKK